ncbi:MAG: site-specific integrase [Candidatus Odinarchaeia archaeon]
MPRVAAWRHLLEEHEDFRRWYDNLARGSINTANENARVLYRFLRKNNMTLDGILDQVSDDRRAFENKLLDFVTQQEKEGKAPTYIENYLKTVNSWLRYNDHKPVTKIKLGNRNRRPTIEDERIPNKDELKQILNYADERGRTSVSLIAFSGLRPETLGNSRGTDGLQIRDLPELEINETEVCFTSTPTRVVVRYELSKAKHKYHTFLGPEGCEYLKAYMEKRLADGEQLQPNTAVITYKSGYAETGYRGESSRESMHLTTKTVTKEIRDAMRPKYDWRPYVLRSYFDTQLLVAENNGKMTHAYRQFFMGHKGDIEAVYTTNKGRLPENLIEDMRESYRRSLEYLETRRSQTDEDRLREDFRKQLLLVAGFSGEEMEGLDLSMGDEEFQETVRRKLLGSMVNNGNSQRVVKIEDVDEFLSKGWNFVAKLSEDKAIINLP